jgi:1,4-dihydroxy-2-naphthoate polyprenyltransferase
MRSASEMGEPALSWPVEQRPDKNNIVVLSSEGVRLWSAPCVVDSFNGSFRLMCTDRSTLENLHRQSRVAFTVIRSEADAGLSGSGMAHIISESSDKASILLEPYRIVSGGHSYELRLTGWKAVSEEDLPGSKFKFWYQAFRAVTLPLSVLPVLVGGAAGFAEGSFKWPLLLLSLLGTVLMHAGANAISDYFDFKKGVDRSTALSSHLGALARERVEPESILLASFACFGLAVLIGLVLVQMVGWVVLFFGLAGLLGSIFYTGRPFSYKYRGLGELMLGVLLGPIIVMGAYYVQVLTWDWSLFLVSIALGMLVSSVTLANNLRDLPDDRAAGIKTLPMAIGISATKRMYYLLLGLPYLVVAGAVILDIKLWPMALIVLSVPRAVGAIRALIQTADEERSIRQKSLTSPFPLNSIRLHFQFGALLLAGVVAAGIIRLI